MSAPKVIIKNGTKWPTKMLRPFVTRIAREEFPGTKPSNTRTKVTLHVRYTRQAAHWGGGGCSGYAYYNSSTAIVRVPYPHPGRVFPVLDFCHVVGHEFGHCKGIKHKDMGLHYDRGAYADAHYAWAKALPVPVIVVKPKPTTDERRLAKLESARAAVARWTTKRKRAETALRTWNRRVRALERTMAKAAVGRVEGTA